MFEPDIIAGLEVDTGSLRKTLAMLFATAIHHVSQRRMPLLPHEKPQSEVSHRLVVLGGGLDGGLPVGGRTKPGLTSEPRVFDRGFEEALPAAEQVDGRAANRGRGGRNLVEGDLVEHPTTRKSWKAAATVSRNLELAAAREF